MTDQTLAQAHLSALGGSPVWDFRAIHDTDKGARAVTARGTLEQCWGWIEAWNAIEYGIFVTVSEMDGVGRELENVAQVRAHFIDLDKGSVEANAQRADQSTPAPWFQVRSSPGKMHVYWPVAPYTGNERFDTLQRCLVQVYGGDPQVVDPTRVMRLSGTLNWKYGAPGHLVTCSALSGYGQPVTIEALEAAYAHVQVIHGGAGQRHDLGDPDLAAPSLEWLQYALKLLDPNTLDRGDWIAIMAAVKQAGWTLTDPDTLWNIWSEWCARYDGNNPAENIKQWRSIRNSQLGWKSLTHRIPSLKPAVQFGTQGEGVPVAPVAAVPGAPPAIPAMPAGDSSGPPALDCSGPFLTDIEQQEYFKGYVWVTKESRILAPDGRFLNQTQFNGLLGSKVFVWTQDGKTTDEPWKAALRSQLWTIPKVDHTRFLPHEPAGAIVRDVLGRKGVNLYVPPVIERIEGDASPFLDHLARLFPVESDRKILLGYLAHNIKYPGHKIPWAPLLQSAEGAGKNVFKELMLYAHGQPYVHLPKAEELVSSGSKFNAWMRHKTFIIVDEIKVDEKRDLLETLKPMISEKLIEVQAKGVDQDLEDNFSNWFFFSNWKDAIPASKNARRWAIFFSALQTAEDVLSAGMDDAYFDALYAWLDTGGCAIVYDWFMRYPIERGKIPMRAPKTSSTDEAITIGRSPLERVIAEAIDDGMPGFRNDWVSMVSLQKRITDSHVVRTMPAPHVLRTMLSGMGYTSVGKASRGFHQESLDNVLSELFFRGQGPRTEAAFLEAQGWG